MDLETELEYDKVSCWRFITGHLLVVLNDYSATGLESRKLFSFAKTIHLMCISILSSLDAVPYI